MGMSINKHRSMRIAKIVQGYPSNPGSCDEAVSDILTDLMHYCKANDEDFTRALEMARENFAEEVAEDEDYSS